MRQYRYLLFDADGTLFDYDKCEIQALKKTLNHCGLAWDPKYLSDYREINHAVWKEREENNLDLELLKIKRFALLFEKHEIKADPADYSEHYLNNLSEEGILLDDVEKVIKALADKYALSIITNGIAKVQKRRFSKTTIEKYFDELIISEEIGVPKPDAKFFEITFDKIGNPAKEDVLVIGDSLSSDIQGANNYGIDACWVNLQGHKNDQKLNIKYEIKHLSELINIL
ncbi:MAG: YjjG family noncanonical pyrimidine nucleotidase, partial [Flavobacteriaceae bacterium]|nr:YjjG family noncanonical pyrimidine nucleotidase [Flavobacteriaceae bacterium]